MKKRIRAVLDGDQYCILERCSCPRSGALSTAVGGSLPWFRKESFRLSLEPEMEIVSG